MVILISSKGFGRAQPIQVVGCRWNRLVEPVFVTTLDFRMTRLRDYEKFYASRLGLKWALHDPIL